MLRKGSMLSLTFATLLGLSLPIPVLANEYAIIHNLTDNEGGFFSAPDVSMTSNWSSSNPCLFVVKTQWLAYKGADPAQQDWIELGRVNGAVRSSTGTTYCGTIKVGFYDTFYTARAKHDSFGQETYEEWPVTSISTGGTHNYQVKKTALNEWTAYIDYTRVLTHTGWNQSKSVRHDIGWETNTATAWWGTPNYSTAHQLLINSSWQNWNTGFKEDASNSGNSLGWYANFDGAYSKAKYTR